MSVIKSRRSKAEPQYITTARKLKLFTRRQCLKLPKRFTFYGGIETAACAQRIQDCATKANSYYPTNQHEAQIRRDYILAAIAETDVLDDHIQDAIESFGIEERIAEAWVALLDQEKGLLDGIKKKDRERYKDLPGETNEEEASGSHKDA